MAQVQVNKLLHENLKLKNRLSQFEEVSGVKPYINDGTIKGGYRIVKSIQERDEIDCCHRKIGMIVSIKISETEYKNYRLTGTNPCSNNWMEVDSDGVAGPPGPIGPIGPPGNISIITFEVNDNMHLLMQLETNTNLDFTIDSNGHLILNN